MAAMGASRDGSMPAAYRTVLCRYFQSGYCPAGESCSFIHSSEDSAAPTTQQCKSFVLAQAPAYAYQQQAFPSHASAAAPSNEYKIDLCPHRVTGACGGSPYCGWAHSVDELVPGKFSKEEIDALRVMARNGGAGASGGPNIHAPQSYMMSPYGEVDGYGGIGTAYMQLPGPQYGPPAAFAAEPPRGSEAHAPAALYPPRYLPPGAPPYSHSPYTPAFAAPPPFGAPPMGTFASPLAHPKAKTKMCTFWPDRCRKGEQCPYIHGEDDPLHVGGPAARMQAAAIASLTGGPPVPSITYFAGPGQNQKRPRPPPNVIGTKFCKFFLVGACTRGSECTFSHDQRVREREEQQKQQQQPFQEQQDDSEHQLIQGFDESGHEPNVPLSKRLRVCEAESIQGEHNAELLFSSATVPLSEAKVQQLHAYIEEPQRCGDQVPEERQLPPTQEGAFERNIGQEAVDTNDLSQTD